MGIRSDRRAVPTLTVHRDGAWGGGGGIAVALRPARNIRTTRYAVEERIVTLRRNRNRAQDDSLMK